MSTATDHLRSDGAPAVEAAAARARLLRPGGDERMYAVIDGAATPGLLEAIATHEPPVECLYAGTLPPDLRAAAPYLVELTRCGAMRRWVVETAWGAATGVVAITGADADLRDVRRHFRGLNTARMPDGRVVVFRWYDPRVLRVYGPTCTAAEQDAVFGPVTRFMLPDEEGESVVVLKRGDAGPELAAGDATTNDETEPRRP